MHIRLDLDILYILLDYCNPIDTNIMTVIDVLVDNEREFDKFIKYSIKNTVSLKNQFIRETLKQNRQEQLTKFRKMNKQLEYRREPTEYLEYMPLVIEDEDFNLTYNYFKFPPSPVGYTSIETVTL